MPISEIKDMVVAGGGILIVLMTFVQVTPIKVNPWSWVAKMFGKLLKAFGRAINSDVLTELEDVKRHQRETQEKLDKHIRVDDERDADNHRQRILRFNSELIDGKNFTHEYFTDMLVEIDDYERYCETHPEYRNNRAVLAIANIKRVYKNHEANGNFLK